MGGPIALNLACGHDVAVFGSNTEALNKLAANGATTVSGLDGFWRTLRRVQNWKTAKIKFGADADNANDVLLWSACGRAD